MQIRVQMTAPMANVAREFIPIAYQGTVKQLRIMPKSGFTGKAYVSILTGVPGSYAQLLAQCEAPGTAGVNPVEVQALASPVRGYAGIHFLPDGNVDSYFVEIDTEEYEK